MTESMVNEVLVKASGVDKVFKRGSEEIHVLGGLDLEIPRGEFLALMGPSGSGKSTLLNIIGMLDKQSQGEYYFMDEPVHKFNERRTSKIHKEHIGFIFQAYHLIDELTVYENIETPLLYRGVKRKERSSMVAEMLDRFQMVAKKDLFPEQLSGGQQQLVAVARAMVASPKLILADEPCGALHSSQGTMIMDLLKNLNEGGTTIIQVTHNQDYANYGSRIIQLHDGWLVDGS